ncbi:MAG: formylglycine-generating enzyme family protein [Bacteroidia bacterium]|nr:formylglycine-generating enzyme family protein [Bacteroidia bacterium]
MKSRSLFLVLCSLSLMVIISGCSNRQAKINRVGKADTKTGVSYGSKKETDKYAPQEYKEAKPAPGLVFIQGGTFIMGGGEKDILHSMDNRERQVSVQSFYIDETEVSNVNWKAFLYDILNNEGDYKFKELYPDTLVWLRDLAYNDPISETYYSHAAFNMYPVVGVNWHQAQEYCKWRTKKVNEALTEKDEDAVLYPSYRLPSEAEWEYAARGLQEGEIYSWEGKSLRGKKGQFRANFKRGRGDYAGWAGGDGKHFSDGYFIPAPVQEFWPNDFGLYNMSGNVAEWTQDTYRVLSLEDNEDLNPYRRKGKTTIRPDQWLDDEAYNPGTSLLYHPSARDSVGTGSPYDNAKVYRGGSWADIAYYLTPGSRRFFNADSSSCTIGFRCAMIKVGSPK